MQMWMLFLPEIIGTLIGAALGLWTASWWDRRKDRLAEDQHTVRTIDSLIGEIEMLRSAAEEATKPRDESDAPVARPGGAVLVTIDMLFFPDAAFRSAVSAGGLGLLPADLQVMLSGFYESVGWARLHRDNIATSYNRSATVRENVSYLENARVHLGSGCHAMLSLVEEVLQELRQQRAIVEGETRGA
jgi:hypothetical protein